MRKNERSSYGCRSSFRYLGAALFAGLAFAACQKEETPAGGTPGQTALQFSAGAADVRSAETRAAPVATGAFHASFGVFAAVYPSSEGWNAETDCDFMNNVEVKHQTGNIYATDAPYYLPGAGKELRFFAYAPYGSAKRKLDEPATIEFTFFVDEDVSKQVDFCVARSAAVAGDGDGTVPLEFQHTLVGARFVTASVPATGKLRSLALRQVSTGAILEVPKDGTSPISWTKWAYGPSEGGGIRDLVLPLDVALSGEAGQEITAEEETFMLLPGCASSTGAKIELLYDPDGKENSGDERTLTAEIGDELDDENMGKIITYQVSIVQDELKLAAEIRDWTQGGEIDGDASTTGHSRCIPRKQK